MRRRVNLMLFFRPPSILPYPDTYYLAGYFCYHYIISLGKVNNFVEILTIIGNRIVSPNSLFTFALGKKGGSFDPPFRFCLRGRRAVRLSDMHHLFSSMSCKISFYKHSIGVIDLPVSVVVRQIPLYV